MANQEINDLTGKTTPVSTDEVEIQETGGGTSKKATVGNLAKGMSYNDLNDKPTIPSGDVVGPASATDRAIALFDSTTGKLIKNSSVLIDSDGAMTGVSDITMASGSVLNASSLGTIRTNQLLESTPASGVTIDGVLIKDGLVDGIDIATDVAANTAKVGITPTQAANITANNAKISYTDAAKVAGIETGATADQTASELLASVGPLIFPVGAIYISGTATNPATTFGFGTWTQIEGKFIVGVSDSDTDFDLDDTGGHKELQSHSHDSGTLANDNDTHSHVIGPGGLQYIGRGSNGSGSSEIQQSGGRAIEGTSRTQNDTHTHTISGDTGTTGTGTGKNLPPYIAKYIWQRTA